jgi:arylsulfatase A-like enzyme
VGRYSTTYIGNESERFLREFEKDDLTPWYLYVATAAPHKPFTASSKYRGTHIRDWKGNPGVRERNTGDKPPFIQEHHSGIVRGNRVRKKQIRTLKSVDDMVTQIKGVLDELGETRDTLAIFTSDNGYLLGEHGFVGKRQPYTDSIEVPLVVRLPGVLPRGGVDHRFAANVDIAPTVLEAAKVPAEDMSSMDGYSLLGDHDRTYMFTEHWGNPHKDLSDWASIRTRDYQYTEYYTRLPGEDSDTISFREYYDLKEDPYELVNLYANHDQQDDPNPVPLGATVEGFRTCSEDSCP